MRTPRNLGTEPDFLARLASSVLLSDRERAAIVACLCSQHAITELAHERVTMEQANESIKAAGYALGDLDAEPRP